MSDIGLVFQSEYGGYFNEVSREFFKKNENGKGGAYIVGLSQFNLSTLKNEISDEDVRIHLKIAKISFDCSKRVLSDICYIFNELQKMHNVQGCETQRNQNLWKCQIPLNYNDIWLQVSESPRSIWKNLPCPKGKILGEHVYFPITETLEVLLGLGYMFEYYPDIEKYPSFYTSSSSKVTNLRECSMINNLCQTRSMDQSESGVIKLHLGFEIFSDDFDPSGGAKGNRNNVWLCTASFNLLCNSVNSSDNTFVLSLGKKGIDHDIIFQEILSDLKKINHDDTKCYIKSFNKYTNVHLDLVVINGDSPEYHDIKHLSRGNSIYTSVRGWSFNASNVWNRIPSCSTCYTYMLENSSSWKEHVCNQCVNWDISNDPFGLLCYTAPDNFPADVMSLNESRKLMPIRITNDQLKRAITTSHENVMLKNWSKSQFMEYLKVNGLNEKTRTTAYVHAQNCSIMSSLNLADEQDEDVMFLRQDAIENPLLYQRFPFPPTWDDVFHDTKNAIAPMHMLCLCTIKNTQPLVFKFLTIRNKKQAMLRQMNMQFDYITDMKLDWCKLLPVETDKFGSWVSENWMGFGRICKWIYSNIEYIAPDFHFQFPNKPLTKWSNKENEGWLRFYGLPRDGLALDKRHRVMENFNNPNLKTPEERTGSVLNIEYLFSSLSAFLSHIMQPEVDEESISHIDRHIRIFLHHVNLIDGVLSSDSSKPYIQSSYSYLSLLGMPDVIRRYGSVRNIWDGRYQGEAFIAQIKPLISDLRKNWHINAGQRHHRMKSLKKILESYDAEYHYSDNISAKHCIYSSLDTIKDMFFGHHPLSIMRLKDSSYVVAFEKEKYVVIKPMYYNKTYFGMPFWYWILSYDNIIDTPIQPSHVSHYCVILPLLTEEDPNKEPNYRSYWLITSEWHEMDCYGKIELYKFSKANYDEENVGSNHDHGITGDIALV